MDGVGLNQTHDTRCRICGRPGMRSFLRIDSAPAHIGVLWSSRQDAVECPRGDIDLCFCNACGFVYNVAFDPARMEYEGGYDNALDFSAVFTDYARALAGDLIERYGLRNADVIDVGCGKGEFLKTICELGPNRGTGFDPDAPEGESTERVRFVREYYSRAHADVPADLITCRHVFEHIDDPPGFLAEVRAAIGARPVPVYFEVPNLHNIVAGNSPWEIIYEHCAYYGAEAMATVFARSGFDVERVSPLYNDTYLGLWASPGASPHHSGLPAAEDVAALGDLVDRFGALFEKKVGAWRERGTAWRREGRTVVAWGAGARGTTFVNLIGGDAVAWLVDINPRKRGHYVPGTGQEIVAPERLVDIRPDVVIVMNPVYMEEIRATAAGLGIDAEFVAA